ncbi:MAG: hypothetical protein JO293_04820, partial [Candidatus Eremiobacteraeota bacterium]|nr:hypothetical protein [Candidatus Eremiobacteraeota bacterium]
RSAILEITLRGPEIASWRAVPVVLDGGVPKPVSGPDAALVEALLTGEVQSTPPPTPAPTPHARPTPAKAAAQPAAHGPSQ